MVPLQQIDASLSPSSEDPRLHFCAITFEKLKKLYDLGTQTSQID